MSGGAAALLHKLIVPTFFQAYSRILYEVLCLSGTGRDLWTSKQSFVEDTASICLQVEHIVVLSPVISTSRS